MSFIILSTILPSATPSLANPLCTIHQSSSRGPQVNCTYCHADPYPGYLNDGLLLDDTTVCDQCHSPTGQFNGTGSAKDNWQDGGVYNGNQLKPGREKWCVNCHDDGACTINGVPAPNIAGLSMSGDWQNSATIVYPTGPDAGKILDGDPETGINSGVIIFDLGDPAVVSHVRLYTAAGESAQWELWGGNDLNTWSRVLLGPSVIYAAPVWLTELAGEWNEIRLDKFIPVRYLKLVKASAWPLSGNYLREFEYKKDLQYGYYVTGHKIECDNCHDLASVHIDGESRTYSASASPNNYQAGYRLKDVEVDGEMKPPLEIPRIGCNSGTNPKTSNDFALCFACHNKYKLLGDAYGADQFMQDPLATNFRNDDHVDENLKVKNEHLRHLQGRGYCGNSKDWDSDWDGTGDSPQSCTACHNVHGSPSPAMIRHGELASTPGTANKSPLLNFQYLKRGVEGDVTDSSLMSVSESAGGQTQFRGSGPGTIGKNQMCNMCHNDKITYHREPVTSPIAQCLDCHTTASVAAINPSHATHLSVDPRGPTISCKICHSDCSQGSPHLKLMADGKSLPETTACDICHSKDGVFDGVNDQVIGAKINWQDGVYQKPERLDLKQGLENWCATCHDAGTSLCSEVSAPNVMGDNATYGYNINGHKIACSACHDLTLAHIDADARTYSKNSNPLDTSDPHNYQNGYRLKHRMIIPLTIGNQGSDVRARFALCFECHDYDKIMDSSAPYQTNFQDDDVNRHLYHLNAGRTAWDSDWNYLQTDDEPLDSRLSCPACHNVHGAPNPAMIRHGELISTPGTQDKVPALDFRWYKEDGFTLTVLGEESRYGDMPPLGGAGEGSFEDNRVCIGCHSGGNLIKYDRVYQHITMPQGTWAKPPLPPSVRILNPVSGSEDVAVDGNLSFLLLSNGQNALELGTFSVSIEGSISYDQNYHYGDSELEVTSLPWRPLDYQVTVFPSANFGDQERITVTISVQDSAGHRLTSPAWSFITSGSIPVIWKTPQAVRTATFFYPERLIDDQLETGNPFAGGAAHSVVFDLGQSYEVSWIRLLLPSPESRRWTIWVSDDPENFGTAVKSNWIAQPSWITVDNTEATFTPDSDTWPSSTAPAGYIGTDYQTCATSASGDTATCTWTPQIPAEGDYLVYALCISSADRAPDAVYTINYDGGSQSVTVNQQGDGKVWNFLGTYHFAQGDSGSIILGNGSSSDGFFVVADAIRLVPVPAWVQTSVTPKTGRYLKLYTDMGPLSEDTIKEVDFGGN
ncbi:MAG: hypothetical protein AB1611_02735 [bacterium]